MSTYSSWDVNKAAEIANAKGQTMGYVTSVYSTPGMTNLCAGVAEAINQDGGSIYQDEFGNFKIVYDRDTKGGSVWTSDALGMTFDYSGDTFQMTPTQTSDWNSSWSSPSNTTSTSSSYTGDTWSSSGYMSSSCDNILNRIDASKNANVSYTDTAGLKSNETLDPISGRKIDKAKSEEIDEILNSKSSQRKFDKIAQLINKVHEAQGQATVVAKDHSTGGALAGAGAGAAIGACVGGPIGAAVGGLIGGVAGFFGGKAVNDNKEAKQANEAAADAAKEAGQELKDAMAELSGEELIAFERYYYQQTGMEVSEVLSALEVTADSSTIAQQTGIDDEWLTSTFDKMDEANKLLDPKAEETKTEETTSYTNSYKADMVKREIDLLRNAWDKAMQGQEVSVNIDGKVVSTVQEIEELINEKLTELEGLQ